MSRILIARILCYVAAVFHTYWISCMFVYAVLSKPYGTHTILYVVMCLLNCGSIVGWMMLRNTFVVKEPK